MRDAPQIVQALTVPHASVRIGWFRRQQVFIYRYDDGAAIIGYPIHGEVGTLLIVPLVKVEQARDTLAGSTDE